MAREARGAQALDAQPRALDVIAAASAAAAGCADRELGASSAGQARAREGEASAESCSQPPKEGMLVDLAEGAADLTSPVQSGADLAEGSVVSPGVRSNGAREALEDLKADLTEVLGRSPRIKVSESELVLSLRQDELSLAEDGPHFPLQVSLGPELPEDSGGGAESQQRLEQDAAGPLDTAHVLKSPYTGPTKRTLPELRSVSRTAASANGDAALSVIEPLNKVRAGPLASGASSRSLSRTGSSEIQPEVLARLVVSNPIGMSRSSTQEFRTPRENWDLVPPGGIPDGFNLVGSESERTWPESIRNTDAGERAEDMGMALGLVAEAGRSASERLMPVHRPAEISRIGGDPAAPAGPASAIEQSSNGSDGAHAPPALPAAAAQAKDGAHGLSEWARDHPPAQDPAFQVPEYEKPQTIAGQLWKELKAEAVEGVSRTRGPDAASDSKRERVYNTMFHVPWRVELLIQLGYLVCLDAFLTIFTILPIRLLILLKHSPDILLRKRRMRADEMFDLCRGLVLIVGYTALQHAVHVLIRMLLCLRNHGASHLRKKTWMLSDASISLSDVSLIYHWIRGQSVIKLVVVFNVLEVLDRLCQTLGTDVIQMLFSMTQTVASCPSRRLALEFLTLFVDVCIAFVTYTAHAAVILCHAVTLNVAINSHNNMLLTLLVSNNFAEVKSNVFKRFSKENVHKLACQDTVERFHLSCLLLFVAVQNIVRGQGASLNFFFRNIGMVWLCETVVDGLKHSFLAKFNEHKPDCYSEYLQCLCRMILEHRSHHVHRTLAFVPLAPAVVVARTMVPLLGLLPSEPLWLKSVLCPVVVACTFGLLLLAKAAVGICIRAYARWYLLRCLVKKDRGAHLHED